MYMKLAWKMIAVEKGCVNERAASLAYTIPSVALLHWEILSKATINRESWLRV